MSISRARFVALTWTCSQCSAVRRYKLLSPRHSLLGIIAMAPRATSCPTSMRAKTQQQSAIMCNFVSLRREG